MGKPGAAVLIAVVATVSACSGANRESTSPTRSTSVSAPSSTTTVHPQPTTTTSTPDFSFDDSVPPPKLVNTGKNYVAILKSLEAYGNWAAAHRPDPASVAQFVASGTNLYRSYVDTLTILRDKHQRGVEKLGGPSRYKIISATSDAFTARVVEEIDAHRILDASRHVIREGRFAGTTTYLDLAVLVDGHWLLAASDVTSAPETLS